MTMFTPIGASMSARRDGAGGRFALQAALVATLFPCRCQLGGSFVRDRHGGGQRFAHHAGRQTGDHRRIRRSRRNPASRRCQPRGCTRENSRRHRHGFRIRASRPIIRGFDTSRVRTLEDGIGSFDVADVGPDHGIPIDPLSAQRIEVIRGAATLRYGSQAIGGVINAINNRVPARLPDEPFAAELTGLYGTNADTRQGSAMFDARVGSFASMPMDSGARPMITTFPMARWPTRF